MSSSGFHDDHYLVPNMLSSGPAICTPPDIVVRAQAQQRIDEAKHLKHYKAALQEHSLHKAAGMTTAPTPRNSSDAIKLETDHNEVERSVNRPLHLPSLPDFSVSGTWSQYHEYHFIVRSGRLEIFQKLLVGGIAFELLGWAECGQDYLVLGLKGPCKAFLVIPDARVQCNAISWACPPRYLFFRLLHHWFGCAQPTFQTCYSPVLVSQPSSLSNISIAHLLL